MLTKQNRLKKNREFQYIYKRGKVLKTEFFYMYVIDTKNDYPKIGFSISKKVGKSVVRSKIKRHLSEFMLRALPSLSIKNYVLVAKPNIVGVDYSEIILKSEKSLKTAGLMK